MAGARETDPPRDLRDGEIGLPEQVLCGLQAERRRWARVRRGRQRLRHHRWLADTLVEVHADGTVQTLATPADGLDYPASVAFGSGDDAASLYLANVGAAFRTPSVMRATVAAL